jgi:hypothetical protein
MTAKEAITSNPILKHVVRSLALWSPLWIATTLAFGAISLLYVLLVKQDFWLASQAIIVRDEANGAVMRLGRFESATQMKAAQEAVLELAKNQQVVKDALTAAGPEPSWFGNDQGWPSRETIDSFAKYAIAVHAPRGVEFGASEFFYLDVKHPDPKRAQQLNQAVCDALEMHSQKLRESRANSIIQELTQARESANSALSEATNQLNELEKMAGSDLSDLRSMTESTGGTANSRVMLDQLKNEVRQLEASHQQLVSDRELLVDAAANQAGFMKAPGSLINSLPGLKRLREGLVDAQLRASQLAGKYKATHPALMAAIETESEIQEQLSRELSASLTNFDQELRVSQARIDRVKKQHAVMEQRLMGLAGSRASYANVVADVRNRTSILENAERELAEAEASRRASQASSLIARVDGPVLSDKPIGPGKTSIVGICTLAGFFTGIGLTFLLSPMPASSRFGRRSSDAANTAAASPVESIPPQEVDPQRQSRFLERPSAPFGRGRVAESQAPAKPLPKLYTAPPSREPAPQIRPAAASTPAVPSKSKETKLKGDPPAVAAAPVSAPSHSAPAEQIPAEQIPAVQIPAVQIPAVQIPAVQIPAVQIPAVQVPAVQVPAVQIPGGQIPVVQIPGGPIPPPAPVIGSPPATDRKNSTDVPADKTFRLTEILNSLGGERRQQPRKSVPPPLPEIQLGTRPEPLAPASQN